VSSQDSLYVPYSPALSKAETRDEKNITKKINTMKRTIQLIGLLLLIIAGQFAYGQTDKEKALEKGKQAVKLEDEGKFEEAIKLLDEAQKLDPDCISYPYELAYSFCRTLSESEFTELLNSQNKSYPKQKRMRYE